MNDPRKQVIYAPDAFWRELEAEAKRQERSMSQIAQFAWRIAKDCLKRMPAGVKP